MKFDKKKKVEDEINLSGLSKQSPMASQSSDTNITDGGGSQWAEKNTGLLGQTGGPQSQFLWNCLVIFHPFSHFVCLLFFADLAFDLCCFSPLFSTPVKPVWHLSLSASQHCSVMPPSTPSSGFVSTLLSVCSASQYLHFFLQGHRASSVSWSWRSLPGEQSA